jgi:phosphoglucosamine mutase
MGLFGTDGIRGRANEGPLTPEAAVAFGRAVAVKFGVPKRPIVIGRDTRLSGPMLESAVAAGIAAMGVDVKLLGVSSARRTILMRTTGSSFSTPRA